MSDENLRFRGESYSSDELEDPLFQDEMESRRANHRGLSSSDKKSILLLFFLYVLQGIPLGLASSIPMILQNKNISYKDQAIFSFVSWPFSLKLLWAPLVDSFYHSAIGRRKSWLIPTQYLIGIFMFIFSRTFTAGDFPGIYALTIMFFFLNFLAATQDIVVDGWALTMLSRQNVGYASTCNSVGQTAGYFIGNIIFLTLESANFCNTYIRSVPQDTGILDLPGFLRLWAWIFIVTTTLVWIFKKEIDVVEENSLSIRESYQMLYKILCLPAIKTMMILLLTCKIGFACTDVVTGLKLIEAGVPKEKISMLAIPLIPLQIILPMVISRYTTGPAPLNVMIKAYPFRLGFGVLLAGIVIWTKQFASQFPLYYYITIVLAYALHQVTVYCIFVALMAFFAQVSDPNIGGTYMTLLNTICNLGGNWAGTSSLWLTETLTVKSCPLASELPCDPADCYRGDSRCITTLDGYYILTVICVIIGFVWLKFWGLRTLRYLQGLHSSAWKCPNY